MPIKDRLNKLERSAPVSVARTYRRELVTRAELQAARAAWHVRFLAAMPIAQPLYDRLVTGLAATAPDHLARLEAVGDPLYDALHVLLVDDELAAVVNQLGQLVIDYTMWTSDPYPEPTRIA